MRTPFHFAAAAAGNNRSSTVQVGTLPVPLPGGAKKKKKTPYRYLKIDTDKVYLAVAQNIISYKKKQRRPRSKMKKRGKNPSLWL
jgi:hypothetical protein